MRSGRGPSNALDYGLVGRMSSSLTSARGGRSSAWRIVSATSSGAEDAGRVRAKHRLVTDHRGVHRPGADRDHTHVVLPHFQHQRAAESQHGMLRCRVRAAAGEPVPAREARHVHDGAVPAPAHRRQNGPGHEEEAPDVGGHGGVPVLERQLLERPGDQHAGVVDEDPDLADGGGDLLDGPGGFGRVADVGRRRGRVDAVGRELRHERVQPGRRARAHAHAITGASEGERRRAADPLGCAGDQCGGDWGHPEEINDSCGSQTPVRRGGRAGG